MDSTEKHEKKRFDDRVSKCASVLINSISKFCTWYATGKPVTKEQEIDTKRQKEYTELLSTISKTTCSYCGNKMYLSTNVQKLKECWLLRGFILCTNDSCNNTSKFGRIIY